MLIKRDTQQNMVEVMFSLPADVRGETVYLVGDFNNWDETAIPMLRGDDGSFFVTLELEKGREYQFRYLVNNSEWHNDWKADRYVPNPYSGDNSIVST
jgi:1,4-alpha-glucan branching enzyme